jgi:hypothetical protein
MSAVKQACETLGISDAGDAGAVRATYLRLVNKWHPDRYTHTHTYASSTSGTLTGLLGFRVGGLIGVWRCRVLGVGPGAWGEGLGLRAEGSGPRVLGLVLRTNNCQPLELSSDTPRLSSSLRPPPIVSRFHHHTAEEQAAANSTFRRVQEAYELLKERESALV